MRTRILATLSAATMLCCASQAQAAVLYTFQVVDTAAATAFVANDLGHNAGYGAPPGSGSWLAINNLDQSVGVSGFTAQKYANGVVTTLSPAAGDVTSIAQDINDAGVAVGSSAPGGPSARTAVYWDADGSVHALDDNGAPVSTALAINNDGLIVGQISRQVGNTFPVFSAIWDNGVLTEFGGWNGGTFSSAWGVNDLGQVVGSADGLPGGQHGYIWEGGVLQDLTDLVGPLAPGAFIDKATAINNSGQILATLSSGASRLQIILTPISGVPEPGTWGLLILGFGGVGAALRQRGRQTRSVSAT